MSKLKLHSEGERELPTTSSKLEMFHVFRILSVHSAFSAAVLDGVCIVGTRLKSDWLTEKSQRNGPWEMLMESD